MDWLGYNSVMGVSKLTYKKIWLCSCRLAGACQK